MLKFEQLVFRVHDSTEFEYFRETRRLEFECVVGGEIVNWTYRFDCLFAYRLLWFDFTFFVSVSVVIASNVPEET